MVPKLCAIDTTRKERYRSQLQFTREHSRPAKVQQACETALSYTTHLVSSTQQQQQWPVCDTAGLITPLSIKNCFGAAGGVTRAWEGPY